MQNQQYYESPRVVNSKEDVSHTNGLSFPISASIDDGTKQNQRHDSLPADAQTHGPPGIAQHMTQESRMMVTTLTLYPMTFPNSILFPESSFFLSVKHDNECSQSSYQ